MFADSCVDIVVREFLPMSGDRVSSLDVVSHFPFPRGWHRRRLEKKVVNVRKLISMDQDAIPRSRCGWFVSCAPLLVLGFPNILLLCVRRLYRHTSKEKVYCSRLDTHAASHEN